MTLRRSVTRRGVLLTGAAGVVAAVLAACSSGSATKKSSRDVVSPPPTGGESPATGATGGAVLATLASVPVGGAVSVRLPDGQPGIVARPTSITAACFSAICTHMGCTVLPAGKQLDCPCHGSVYDAGTGKVLAGPAPAPLPKIAVTVRDGKVVKA